MKPFNKQDYDIINATYRTNFSDFIKRTFNIVSGHSVYKHNWHIDCIAEHLEACRRGEIKRLVINWPPRFLKSISCSVAFPAFLLGHNPAEQILCASYSKDLAITHGVNCRAVIQSDWYQSVFPNLQLAPDQNTKSKFKTSAGGVRYSVGVGGTITGEGGNFIIIDDPINASEAHSQVVRDSTNEWFGQTAYTRLNDKKNGCIIVIMQRLHHNDLTGFLLEQGGWDHLKIQLVSEENKKFSVGSFSHEVKEDELLSPEQMGADEIAELKRRLGPYNYAAQFQQNPSPLGGGEFRREWLRFYDGKPTYSTMNTYIFVDPANSKKKSSDYTAMVVIGLGSDDNFYILDIVRDKLNLRERQQKLFSLQVKYKPKAVLYEKYGMSSDIEAMNEAMQFFNHRFTITEVGGALSKEDRIRRLIPHFADGRIYLPREMIRADWNNKPIDVIEEFVEQEYLTFPVGVHDDLIDAISRLFDTQLVWPNQAGFNYHEFAAGFR